MSYYVHRVRAANYAPSTAGIGYSYEPSHSGWVGPIRSRAQAVKEAQAWQSCGWDAVVFESNPEIRTAVRLWQKDADRRLSRTR